MDRRTLAAAYDRSAEGYDGRFRALQQVKYEAAARFLEVPGRCLDAGGGTGLLLEFLRARGVGAGQRWTVLDLSRGMLREARGRTPLLVCGDLARPPLRPGAFALVAAFTSVLAETPLALGALARLVAPRGRLAVSFLAAEAPPAEEAARHAGLSLMCAPFRAGQDVIFVLSRA